MKKLIIFAFFMFFMNVSPVSAQAPNEWELNRTPYETWTSTWDKLYDGFKQPANKPVIITPSVKNKEMKTINVRLQEGQNLRVVFENQQEKIEEWRFISKQNSRVSGYVMDDTDGFVSSRIFVIKGKRGGTEMLYFDYVIPWKPAEALRRIKLMLSVEKKIP